MKDAPVLANRLVDNMPQTMSLIQLISLKDPLSNQIHLRRGTKERKQIILL